MSFVFHWRSLVLHWNSLFVIGCSLQVIVFSVLHWNSLVVIPCSIKRNLFAYYLSVKNIVHVFIGNVCFYMFFIQSHLFIFCWLKFIVFYGLLIEPHWFSLKSLVLPWKSLSFICFSLRIIGCFFIENYWFVLGCIAKGVGQPATAEIFRIDSV